MTTSLPDVDAVTDDLPTDPIPAVASRPGRRPRRRPSLLIDAAPTGRKGRLRRVGLRVLSVAIFLVAWWAVTRFELVEPKFIPKPGAVYDRFQQSIHTETKGTADFPIVKDGIQNSFLWEHWWASMTRLLWGLFWSVAVGVPLGLLLVTVRWFRFLFEPYLDFLRALPPLAYFSLLILWFGINDTSKIWLLFLAGLAPIALSVVSGARGIPRDRVLAAQALGASRLQTIRHLVLPSVLPDFFNGLRLAVGFILTTIVAAETTAGLPGIGGLAWVSKKTGNGDTVILCIFVIGATALVLDAIVKALDRRLVPWRGRG